MFPTMISLVVAFAVFAAAKPFAQAPPQATAPAVPDPNSVWIENITWAGSGCEPSSHVATALSDDRTTVTLIYPDFSAQWEPRGTNGWVINDARRNCQVNFKLHYPQGFSYTIVSADYRGFAGLDASCTGSMKTTYYFSGENTQYTTDLSINGFYFDNYLKSDTAANAAMVWSPCGAQGMLNTNAQAQVMCSNSTGSGVMTVDSQDDKFTTIVHLQWRSCTQ